MRLINIHDPPALELTVTKGAFSLRDFCGSKLQYWLEEFACLC